MEMNELAKNLLLDHTCKNCKYCEYSFDIEVENCHNTQKPIPEDNTCKDWEVEVPPF